tara:strand:- start:635 stop:772 length:138 start_codon:yes stop_codon:yes gene_type:complete
MLVANVIKIRMIVMNKLTLTELNNIYPLGENRTGKPIFIDFYADW